MSEKKITSQPNGASEGGYYVDDEGDTHIPLDQVDMSLFDFTECSDINLAVWLKRFKQFVRGVLSK